MSDRSRSFVAGSRMAPQYQLSDEHWLLIRSFFPHEAPGPQGGRPRVEPRACLEGILWILRSGARWKDLPSHFPSYPTCWRRLVEWTAAGVWQRAWARLVRVLDDLGQIDWEQAVADGTFASAKKGVTWSARPSVARAPSSCCLPTGTTCHWQSISPVPVPQRSI